MPMPRDELAALLKREFDESGFGHVMDAVADAAEKVASEGERGSGLEDLWLAAARKCRGLCP